MVNNREFLSVAEFASTVNLTKQAVYNRLNKDLKPFVKTFDGVKYLSVQALQNFNSMKDSKNCTSDLSTIEELFQQLESKDKTIEMLQNTVQQQLTQIENLQSHIIQLSTAQTDILNKQSQLQENFQILLGHQQQQLKTAQTIETTNVEQETEEPKKQGFFSRLFNK